MVGFLLWAALSMAFGPTLQQGSDSPSLIQVEALAPLPDSLGTGGAFAGLDLGHLLVVGGSNFPSPLAEGGQKRWLESVYVLPDPVSREQTWLGPFSLPHPLAYGASVSTEDGLWLLGGTDGLQARGDSYFLRWQEGALKLTKGPPLPFPRMEHVAVRIGSKVYCHGGRSQPGTGPALRDLWVFDLDNRQAGWLELPPCPGPGRIFPAMGAQEGRLYLFGGADLQQTTEGWQRVYLRDGWRFDPASGTWASCSAPPQAAVAAPSPMPALGGSHLLLLGGDDGKQLGIPPALHDGFSPSVRAYHTITDTWVSLGELPEARVTTTAVSLADGWILPSGEIRPGVRSPQVDRASVQAPARGFGTLDGVLLAAYLSILVAMGFYFAGREKTTDDYFRAGSRIPWWAAGLSIFGTQLSSITFMAIPAKVYATDWLYFLAQVCIFLVAPVVVYRFLPVYRRLNVTTAYEFLEHRFNLPVRLFGAVSFILFQFGRMGVVLFLPAMALSAVTGFNVYACILLMGVLATVYTVAGGIEAVIWTDVLQVVLLLGGALLSLGIITRDLPGGFGGLLEQGMAEGKFRAFHWSWDATQATVWVVLFGNFLSTLVPYATDQTMIQRYMTTANQKQAARSIWTNAIMTIPASILFYLVGTGLWAFFKQRPEALDPNMETDAVFAWFIAQELPVGLSGLVIAALFAAAMSSLDSSMNCVAAVVMTDFVDRFRKAKDPVKRLRQARAMTVLWGMTGTGVALWMASSDVQSLVDVFMELLGLLGGTVGGLFVLGVFVPRAHGRGAMIGAVASASVLYWVRTFTPLHFFLYSAVGMVSCVGIGWLSSLLLPSDSKARKQIQES
ncbi:MAG: sodium:solute symporter [Planctomycetota bacterium]|nr:MAG: sodium:solute symporter [Planctomycetota bacterium]